QGNSGEKVPGQESEKGLCHFRALGIRGGRHPSYAAAAISHRSHAIGRGRHAISHEKVSDGSGGGARPSVHHSCLSRLPLRTEHCEVFFAVLLAGTDCTDRILCSRRTVRPVRVQTAAEG